MEIHSVISWARQKDLDLQKVKLKATKKVKLRDLKMEKG